MTSTLHYYLTGNLIKHKFEIRLSKISMGLLLRL